MSMRYVITPRDQISTAFVYVPFDVSHGWKKPSISGALKAGVPVRVCSAVSPSIARLLMPKSAILTHQSGPLHTISMFYVDHIASAYVTISTKRTSRLTAGFKSL